MITVRLPRCDYVAGIWYTVTSTSSPEMGRPRPASCCTCATGQETAQSNELLGDR